MKTLTELNDKIWYRFLKVLYILFFIPIFAFSLLSGFVFISPNFNNEKSYIECDDGRKIWLAENNIHLSGEYVDDLTDEKFKNMCFTATGKYRNKITGETISAEEFIQRYGIRAIPKNYKLISFYKRNWAETIKVSFIFTGITIFLFEIIKRTFYYIVLGNFRPPK
jgi:NDP-sugar pyrophosphorylase family protein